MKWFGIICLFLTCTGIGIHAAGRMRTRYRHTQQLSALLGDFGTYIRYQSTPLEELLHLFAEHPNYTELAFLKNVSRAFCTGIPPRILWQDAIAEDNAVSQEEAAILSGIGNVLGTTDMQGQLAALELYRSRMDALADTMQENCRKKSELYPKLGVLLGTMLALLII